MGVPLCFGQHDDAWLSPGRSDETDAFSTSFYKDLLFLGSSTDGLVQPFFTWDSQTGGPWTWLEGNNITAIFSLSSHWNLAFHSIMNAESRSHWLRGLKRGSAAIAYWDWGFESRRGHGCLSCEFCVLSCVGLIPCPEESYQVWCVWVWSWSFDNEEALAPWGMLRSGNNNV
jgi:hypothetical protein